MAESKNPTFSKIMLASGLGTLLVLIIIGIFKLLLFFGIIGAMASDTPSAIVKQSFLKIDLTKAMNERSPSELETLINDDNTVGFTDLLRSIDAAASDNKINGIYLYMGSSFPLSWGKCEELRSALIKFCDSGKPVLAYADAYSQKGYYVASVSDSIYLNPSGMVEFQGIAAGAIFYKQLLDKLAVEMTLVRPKSNSFKSAGETYTMDHMSDANRTQVRQYINSIWEYVVEQIGEDRDISPEQLNSIADKLEACLPEDALKNNLIDRLCFENDVKQTMTNIYESKQTVTVDEYCKSLVDKAKSNNKIAIIYAEGEVVAGSGYQTAVYSDKVTKALDEAAEDDNIKAIVLRVNSPGGMVSASEIMTNAVIRAKAKKPVVVSMGDVAASAGYEISSNADYIIAEPTTLTGSIGAFAALPEIGGTLRKYLGITTDTVKTNTNSTSLSILRPMSPAALELMQRNVEEFYTVFVGRVAEGRSLPYEYVDSIARGRVWTGRDALKLKLVDALGGLSDAISVAAERANIKEYKAIDYPEGDNLLTELLNRKNNSSGTAKARANQLVAEYYTPVPGDGVWVGGKIMLETLNRILDTRGLQSRVEFFLLED